MALATDLSAVRRRVRAVLDALGHAGTAATEPLADWIATVGRWNERVDLTAARSDDELVDLLVADATVLAGHVAGPLVDVGAGAGAPGLGVAVLRPDVRVTLVEPLAKRVALLRTGVGALRLSNVEVTRGRVADLDATVPFASAVSRATLPPAEWLLAGRRLSPGGAVYVLLAQGEPPSSPGERVDGDWSYTLPLTGASRRTLRFVPAG
ncbi:MAG: class I SAM-dependent methyltransferase [Polyangiaceae bacterium]|nr:class I SAM-dependent methyltransferase [Polyangiaceae bacterium]